VFYLHYFFKSLLSLCFFVSCNSVYSLPSCFFSFAVMGREHSQICHSVSFKRSAIVQQCVCVFLNFVVVNFPSLIWLIAITNDLQNKTKQNIKIIAFSSSSITLIFNAKKSLILFFMVFLLHT